MTVKKFNILFCSFFLISFLARSQGNQKLCTFLNEEMNSTPYDQIHNDTLKENKYKFIIPRKNGDILLSHVIQDLEKEKNELKRYCNGHGEIKTEYEVKMYVKGKVISILEIEYYYCQSLPSPAYESRTYNYLYYDNHIYKIIFKENNAYLNRIVDSIVHVKFEKDCIENGTLNGKFDLFIDKAFYINNPLQGKTCDEPIQIKNAVNYLKFTKVD